MRAMIVLSVAGSIGGAVLVGQLRAGPGAGLDALPVTEPPGGAAGGCTPSTGPDVIVGQLPDISRYGTIDGISAYALGTVSCNIGSQVLQWQASNNHHPVIAQNLYRLKDGRFEQIGMSWLKHGFSALTDSLCCTCTNPNNSQLLGIGCSDPYGSFLNGDQGGFPGCGGACGGLGPHFQVNATTGVFTFPYFAAGQAGDAIYKRLQVHMTDLDPALNPGATYYGEGQYVTPEDSAAANHHNNASYNQVLVGVFNNGSWILNFSGSTVRELPAIYAWQASDPLVVINVVEDDGGAADAHDGRFRLGYRVTSNGDGTWHYEYAIYNMNSHRSAQSFTVPVPPGVTISNAGFHDVDYHSGDGEGGVTYDGTDWAFVVGAGQATWATQTIAENQNANALRWGTMYNFRFDADTPPNATFATIGLFRAGTPSDVTTPVLGPAGPACPWDLDGDGQVGITDFLDLLKAWGSNPGGPPDFDANGTVDVQDFLELLQRWGECPLSAACGNPEAGSCFSAHAAPGCNNQDCCETVCAAQPACCEASWDESCKVLANDLCGNCGDPGAGSCCLEHATPGCDDATCCRAVCVIDPFCCTGAWDFLCVIQAETTCGCM